MSYFTDALSNFTTEVAYKDAIHRLYDKGLSVEEIKAQCLYPVTTEIVEKVISDYKAEKAKPKSIFVEDYDKYGRKTLRKITSKQDKP